MTPLPPALRARLEQIRQRMAKITPEPWLAWSNYPEVGVVKPNREGPIAICTTLEDAQFIASAPADIAYLIEAIELADPPQAPEASEPAWAKHDYPMLTCFRGHTERQPKCPACHEIRIKAWEAEAPPPAPAAREEGR